MIEIFLQKVVTVFASELEYKLNLENLHDSKYVS